MGDTRNTVQVNGVRTQRNTNDSSLKSRHIADSVAAAMIFNIAVLPEYEGHPRAAVATTPLSIRDRQLTKGLAQLDDWLCGGL
jgi:hypothetical protein